MNNVKPNTFNPRVATYNDLEEIVRLDQNANLTFWTIGQYQSALASKSQQVLVLEADGIIVAVLVLLVALDQADILQLVVLPSYQKRGLAYWFLSTELSKLRTSLSVKQVMLEVRVDNQRAIDLYTALGFKKVSVRRNYYQIKDKKIDAVIMLLEMIV